METLTVETLLWNGRQTAKAMDISERTLWQLTKDGKIPHVRIGKLVKYDPSAVREWISKNSRADHGPRKQVKKGK